MKVQSSIDACRECETIHKASDGSFYHYAHCSKFDSPKTLYQPSQEAMMLSNEMMKRAAVNIPVGGQRLYAWIEAVAALETQLAEAEKERDDIAYRLSCVLDYATGGRMSKTNYTKEAMYDEIDSYYQQFVDEAETREAELRELFIALRDEESQDEAYRIWNKIEEALETS